MYVRQETLLMVISVCIQEIFMLCLSDIEMYEQCIDLCVYRTRKIVYVLLYTFLKSIFAGPV